MTLLSRLEEIERHVKNAKDAAVKTNLVYFKTVEYLVRKAQLARLAKNYTESDEIRKLLNECGIEIIQGTLGHEYVDIPNSLRGHQVYDTWRQL